MSDHKQKPTHRIRSGLVSVAIFENKLDDGKTFYNAQFQRSYRSGEDWKRTSSFGKDDLLPLAKLSDQAHSWIQDKLQAKSAAASSDAA
jgi:hypothetical protein